MKCGQDQQRWGCLGRSYSLEWQINMHIRASRVGAACMALREALLLWGALCRRPVVGNGLLYMWDWLRHEQHGGGLTKCNGAL